jgi:hypothetical protein
MGSSVGGTKSASGDAIPKLFMLAEAISDIGNPSLLGNPGRVLLTPEPEISFLLLLLLILIISNNYKAMPGKGYILEEPYCYLSLHVTNGFDRAGFCLPFMLLCGHCFS